MYYLVPILTERLSFNTWWTKKKLKSNDKENDCIAM